MWALAACSHERRLAADDCAAVRDRLGAAWKRDAQTADHLNGSEAHGGFIQEEEQRIGEAWLARCNALVGQRVDERELACLRKVETVDDVAECAR